MKLENNLMFTKKKELKEKSNTAIAEQSKASSEIFGGQFRKRYDENNGFAGKG